MNSPASAGPRHVSRVPAPVALRRLRAPLPALLLGLLTGALVLAVSPPAPAATGQRTVPGIARFTVPAGTGQLIVVRAATWRSSHATVEAWQRTGGRWVRARAAVAGRVGAKGVAVGRVQSSLQTPAGAMRIRYAFGSGGDPGTRLGWRRFDRDDYWVYDPKDPRTYNTYQGSRPRGAAWRTSWAERLASYGKQYQYALVLDYNLPKPGRRPDTRRGGGIFLHVNGRGATAGCVSVPEGEARALVRWLDPRRNPMIVIGEDDWLAGRSR